jgi:hypothetical protein
MILELLAANLSIDPSNQIFLNELKGLVFLAVGCPQPAKSPRDSVNIYDPL